MSPLDSSVPSTSFDAIISRLQSCAGVTVSTSWLASCQNHIRAKNGDPNNEDLILFEILHCDLRQVLAETNNSTTQQIISLPMENLRKAIEASFTGTFHHTIPSNPLANNLDPQSSSQSPQPFRLMLQAEEILDVSINAEARYSHGPANPSSPTPIGQQKSRCLKILLSDGYSQTSTSTPSSPLPPIIGIEVKPIPDLSVHSNPGIKLLLRTPLSIRYGVLLLHEGNTLVLGGNIPKLMEIQKKAVELAEKNSMVNVDPTIRALISRDASITFGETEEDEAEGESTDVVSQNTSSRWNPLRTTTETTTGTAAIESILNHRSTNVTNTARNQTPSGTMTTEFRPINSLTHAASTAAVSRANPPVYDNATLNGTANSALAQTNSALHDQKHNLNNHENQSQFRKQSTLNFSRPPQHRPSESPKVLNEDSKVKSAKPINPYLQSSSSNRFSSLNSSSTNSNSSSSNRDANVHNKSNTLTQSPDNSRATISTNYEKNNFNGTQTPRVNVKHRIPGSGKKSSPLDLISPAENSVASSPTTPNMLYPTSNPRLPMSPTALSSPISFDELLNLLSQAAASQSSYKQLEEKVFIVPSKMKGSHKDFNIVKDLHNQLPKKSKDKKSKRKYVYTMTCRWTGPSTAASSFQQSTPPTNSQQSQSTSLITCKLSNALLEPYFGMPADDMRRMNRTDKIRCQRLVQEGGVKAVSDVQNGFQNYSMKFLYRYDDWIKLEEKDRNEGIWMIILKKTN